jgi:outer membrane protein TolC
MLQAPFKPMIGLNAFGSKGQGEMIFSSTTEPLSLSHMNGDEQGTLNGMVMWKVFSFGRDRVAAQIAKSDNTASKEMARVIKVELDMSVRLAYSAALYRNDAVKARQESLASAEEMLRVTQAQFDVGKAPQAFVLRAKSEVSSMQRELAMAQADANGAIVSLKEAMGGEQTEALELGSWDASLDAPASLSDALSMAHKQRSELVALERSQKSYALRAKMFQLSSFPELSLTAMGDWMSLSGFQPDTAYRFGFVLSFPLGDGGERRSSMNEQKAMADKAAADLKQTKLKAEAEVASAWAEWQAAPTVQKASDDQLASAEEAYRIALLRYREGKTILAEVIDARSQLVAAQLAKAEAENYTRRAWTMLQRAMGQ